MFSNSTTILNASITGGLSTRRLALDLVVIFLGPTDNSLAAVIYTCQRRVRVGMSSALFRGRRLMQFRMCDRAFRVTAVLIGAMVASAHAFAFPAADLDQTNIIPGQFAPFEYMTTQRITDAFTGTRNSVAQSFTVGKTGMWYGFTFTAEGPHHNPINNVPAPTHTLAWQIWNVNGGGSITTPVLSQSGTFSVGNIDVEMLYDVPLNSGGIPVAPSQRYAIVVADQTTMPSFPNFGPVGSARTYAGDFNQLDNYAPGQGFFFDPNVSNFAPLAPSQDLLFATYVTPEPASAALLAVGALAFLMFQRIHPPQAKRSRASLSNSG